jgi:pimeloyl-[acyl-carrier protein] methyl ester esterase
VSDAKHALVLLPGLDGTGNLFGDLVAALPREIEVVVGRYPSDDILSYDQLFHLVMEILPPRPFVVVAESFSTPLAVKIAASRPSKLAGTILCAGFVTSPVGKWAAAARLLTLPATFRVPPPSWALRRFLIGDGAPRKFEDGLRATIATVKPEVLAGRVRAALDCDVRGDLALYEGPSLYIQGTRDRLVDEECFQEIRSIRPAARLAVIDAPHLVFQCEPTKSAEAILKFLNEIQNS